jgi:trehalose 6-phosphate synthase/phosphatase
MKLIVVANREPYHPERQGKEWSWRPAVGGLTAALDPVLRELGVLGWPGESELRASSKWIWRDTPSTEFG